MSCDCNPSTTPTIYTLQYQYNPSCNPSIPCTTGCTYTGPNLSCSGINTNDTIETALQKIDVLVCESAGDYSTYNMHCLDDDGVITTEADFVNFITDYVCTLNSTVNTFIDTTFTDYQTIITQEIADTQLPAITCASASVTDTDDLTAILNKYCTKFASLTTAIDISSVTWNGCFTVGTTPTTIAAGFNLLGDQICELYTTIGDGITLPTFNNSGSCLSITGTADTLVNTVNALRTRVCQSPVFNINTLSWGCIDKPSTATTNLQAAFQSVLTKVNDITQVIPTFSSDFIVTAQEEDEPCAGIHVALATPLNTDRFVAATSTDTNPSTLINKLVAGNNITLSSTAVPGKIQINAANSSNGLIYADPSDPTLGYLIDKVKGATNDCITISTSYDDINHTVIVTPSIDMSCLVTNLITTIQEDSTLYTAFCALVSGCPSPCQPPTNVQALYSGVSTTTTTLP